LNRIIVFFNLAIICGILNGHSTNYCFKILDSNNKYNTHFAVIHNGKAIFQNDSNTYCIDIVQREIELIITYSGYKPYLLKIDSSNIQLEYFCHFEKIYKNKVNSLNFIKDNGIFRANRFGVFLNHSYHNDIDTRSFQIIGFNSEFSNDLIINSISFKINAIREFHKKHAKSQLYLDKNLFELGILIIPNFDSFIRINDKINYSSICNFNLLLKDSYLFRLSDFKKKHTLTFDSIQVRSSFAILFILLDKNNDQFLPKKENDISIASFNIISHLVGFGKKVNVKKYVCYEDPTKSKMYHNQLNTQFKVNYKLLQK